MDYAHNIFNPFIRTGARIPHSPIVSSQMVTTFAKGVFNTNAAGLGFIQVAPMRGIASDGNLGNVTSNLYAGTTFPAFGTAFTALLNTNSPYTLADFDVADDTCLSARVVSAGIRIRFVGTELNKGGRVYGLDSEGHFSLIGRDLTSVAEDQVSHEDPLNTNWAAIRRHTMYPSDFDYQKWDTGALQWRLPSSAISIDNQLCMGFAIQSAVATQPIEYEFYGHYEVFGYFIRDREAVKSSDHEGVSLVQSAMADQRLKMRNHPKPPSDIKETIRTLANAATSVQKVVLGGFNAAKETVGTILSSFL